VIRNKVDLFAERQVSTAQGVELAKRYNIPFFEASAKTRVNVTEQFYKLVWEVIYQDNLPNGTPSQKKKNCNVM
jgi:GTPase SAR1 family protein